MSTLLTTGTTYQVKQHRCIMYKHLGGRAWTRLLSLECIHIPRFNSECFDLLTCEKAQWSASTSTSYRNDNNCIKSTQQSTEEMISTSKQVPLYFEKVAKYFRLRLTISITENMDTKREVEIKGSKSYWQVIKTECKCSPNQKICCLRMVRLRTVYTAERDSESKRFLLSKFLILLLSRYNTIKNIVAASCLNWISSTPDVRFAKLFWTGCFQKLSPFNFCWS